MNQSEKIKQAFKKQLPELLELEEGFTTNSIEESLESCPILPFMWGIAVTEKQALLETFQLMR